MVSQEAQIPAQISFAPTLENGKLLKSGLLSDLRKVMDELERTELKRSEAVAHLEECVNASAE